MTLARFAGTRTGTPTLTFSGSGNTTVTGAITQTGTMSLTYNGGGTLTLNGANSYSGTTTISSGTVKLTGSGTLGATTSTLGAIGSGAVLDLNGTSQTVDGFSGTSGGQIQNNSGSGTSTLTVGGISNTSTFAGIIADNNGVATGGKVSLVKNGTGTLTLSNGSNTFSGGTSLNAGGIAYSASGALGTGAVVLNAASAQTVTLTLGTFVTLANAIQVNGAGTNLVVGTSGATGQVNGVNGGITLNSANLTYRQTGNGGLRLQTTGITSTGTGGNITFENNTTSNTNAGIDIRVAVNNTGTLTFGGTGNSVTNSTVLSRINATGGSIGLNVTGIVQDSLANLDFAGSTASASTATFEVKQGQVFLNNTASLRVGNLVSVASGATLDVRQSNTIAGLNNISGSGGTVTNSNTADTVLTIGASSGNNTFAGTLTDGSTNKLGLTKLDGSIQIFTGANTYTGATTIGSVSAGTPASSIANGGTLVAAGAGALGSGTTVGTTAITVNNGGTLLINNSASTDHVRNNATVNLGSNGGTGGIGGTVKIATGVSEGAANTVGSGTGSDSITSAAGLGALTLSSSSTLDFDSTGGSTLMVFSGFTPGTFTLNVIGYANTNFSGTAQSGFTTDDRLVFNITGGLNGTQLAAITFDGIGGAQQINLGGDFYEIGITAVPEPSTWLAGIFALGTLGYTQRRRLRGIVSARALARLWPRSGRVAEQFGEVGEEGTRGFSAFGWGSRQA